jgi:hypothetical protein
MSGLLSERDPVLRRLIAQADPSGSTRRPHFTPLVRAILYQQRGAIAPLPVIYEAGHRPRFDLCRKEIP